MSCLDGYGPGFPDCRPSCLADLKDDNGIIQLVSTAKGGTAALECNAGFMVAGGDGIWTCDDVKGSGRCVEATCDEEPPSVEHATSTTCTRRDKVCDVMCE